MWVFILYSGYSNNAILMIITSVIYLALDVWGLVSFIKLRKKQEVKQIPTNAENVEAFNKK